METYSSPGESHRSTGFHFCQVKLAASRNSDIAKDNSGAGSDGGSNFAVSSCCTFCCCWSRKRCCYKHSANYGWKEFYAHVERMGWNRRDGRNEDRMRVD